MTRLHKPITRKSDAALDGSFGPDRDKALVVTLLPGGLISLRPERTRRAEVVALIDVYRFAVRCRAARGQLEKARARKVKLQERRERRSLDRAYRKLKERRVQSNENGFGIGSG